MVVIRLQVVGLLCDEAFCPALADDLVHDCQSFFKEKAMPLAKRIVSRRLAREAQAAQTMRRESWKVQQTASYCLIKGRNTDENGHVIHILYANYFVDYKNRPFSGVASFMGSNNFVKQVGLTIFGYMKNDYYK